MNNRYVIYVFYVCGFPIERMMKNKLKIFLSNQLKLGLIKLSKIQC